MGENARESRAIRYLLGQMSAQEEDQFEAQYFADNNLFEEMVGLENELIDSYVRGELSGNEKQQFERGYLTSAGSRENLRFAKALADDPAKINSRMAGNGMHPGTQRNPLPATQPRMSPARVAFAAMCLVAIACISWLSVVNQRLHRDLDRISAQQTELQRKEADLRQQVATLSAQVRDQSFDGGQVQRSANMRPPGPDIIALALAPGLDRGTGGPKKLAIVPAVLLVQLQLYLKHDDYPSYNAILETVDGVQVWKKTGLKGHPGRGTGGSVTLGIPAAVLRDNDYLVRLAGVTPNGKVEEVEDYRFLVVARSQ